MSGEKEKIVVFKFVLLGDAAVGKTSLVDIYTQHKFREDYKPTLGVNIVVKEIKIEEINAQIRLVLWDIAGQEKYDISRKMFFQGVLGALLVYDTTREVTFNNIESKWLKDLNKYSEGELSCILIGNKTDLNDSRAVSTEKGRNFADKINAADFIETSAKYGDNVEDAFKKLVYKVLKNLAIMS
ncbi:MAG: GTP-binding protein [Candidatus Lokiarchaeota archaeon]|nr:GTP-binding protein [Candidatus Lokiarchaeota archaeon]